MFPFSYFYYYFNIVFHKRCYLYAVIHPNHPILQHEYKYSQKSIQTHRENPIFLGISYLLFNFTVFF